MTAPLWVVGTRPARVLAEGLGADLHELPSVVLDPGWTGGHHIEQWRERERAGPPAANVVVAVWSDPAGPAPLADLDLHDWATRLETPFALWFAALAVACERCAEGGQVVAVTDRPEARDSAGWGAESGVADAVEVMARSLAQGARSRRVRINLVSTSARLSDGGGGTPGLDPGLLGAVGMLLSAGGPGVDLAVIRVEARR